MRNNFKNTNSSSKKEKSKKSFSLLKPLKNKWDNFLLNDRIRLIIGFSLIFLSFYALVSFTSYLFTWKADYDLLFRLSTGEFLNPEIRVANWGAKFGAIISNLFIREWFGIVSFLFIPLFFLIGIKFLLKVTLLPIRKTFTHILFFLVWIPSLLSFCTTNSELLYLGGGLGYNLNNWLNSVLGNIGVLLILALTFLSYLVITFNIKIESIKNVLNKILFIGDKKISNPDDINENNPNEITHGNIIDEDVSEIPKELSFDEEPEIISSETKSDEAITEPDDDFEIIPTTTQPEVISSPSDNDDELALDVEESIEEEELSDKEVNKKVQDFGEYDPKLDLASFELPKIDLLENHGDGQVEVNREELEANKNRIVETLGNYNIGIDKIKATIGPTVTLYEIVPVAGVRISKIKNLEDDIALSLSALGIRIIAPIPGRGTIGIEVPNSHPETVSMRAVIASEKFQNTKMELPVALGKTISNETFVADLAKMPHLLMAGATGQGKSVGLNAILVSLLYKKHPSQIKFVLVDPKKVELTLFNKIERHYLAKLPDSEEAIITDNNKVIHTLNSLCIEMDQRYELLKEAHCRNLKEYNAKFIKRKLNPEKGHKYLPYIVLVVDEFADLIMTAGKEVETPVARLAQLARAIGIHLIIATQRPSVNVITGTIKANFPTRIAFRVMSKIDSRTILDAGGADQLIGRGDMLISTGNEIVRLQCAFVDTPEVEKIADFIGEQRGYPHAFELPEYIDESSAGSGDIDIEDRDTMFEEAARIIVIHQQGSASLLQRKLKLGYNRAGRIVDQLEAAGIIGPSEGSKARQVLIPDEYSLEQLLNQESQND